MAGRDWRSRDCFSSLSRNWAVRARIYRELVRKADSRLDAHLVRLKRKRK